MGVLAILFLTGLLTKYPGWIFCGSLLAISVLEIATPHRKFQRSNPDYITNKVCLKIPSGQLLVTSFWEENNSDIVLRVPQELEIIFHLINGKPVEIVRSVTISGASQDLSSAPRKVTINVDGGYLLIGDLPFTRSIQKKRKSRKRDFAIV